jgi:transposase
LYHLKDKRFGCRRCRYKFGELTGTYLEEFYISLVTLVHLLYLYALGVPAYRIRFYLSISLTTIERTFRIFRQSIYIESLQKLKELKKLSEEIEMDEALFGGHRNVDGVLKVKASYLEYIKEMARSSHFLYLTENKIH